MNPSPGAAKKFMAVEEAYTVLSDASARRAYDRKRANPGGRFAKSFRSQSRRKAGPTRSPREKAPSSSINNTFYSSLGVSHLATPQMVRAAYLKLSREYHPSKGKTKDRWNRFVAIEQAYHVLGKMSLRVAYDSHFIYNNRVLSVAERRPYRMTDPDQYPAFHELDAEMEDGRLEAYAKAKLSFAEYLFTQTESYRSMRKARPYVAILIMILVSVVNPAIQSNTDDPSIPFIVVSVLAAIPVLLIVNMYYDRFINGAVVPLLANKKKKK